MARTELLLPAGDLAKLKAAILYGADAVYAGTPDLSLRSTSGFGLDELREGIEYAHARGKRVYLTLNLFSHNRDIDRLASYLDTIRSLGPDGVIVADLGVLSFLRERAPELEVHVSTQANITSWLTVDAYARLGAKLVVLARELSLAELAEIRERCPDVRLETFVHGAMCMTYSGRCLLSNYLAERGSNQGSCAHSCRWRYQLKVQHQDGSEGTIEINDQNMGEFSFFLEEEFRRGQLFPIEEDEHGSYILNSRDLNLMPVLADYLALGLDSFKIEGRSKSEFYAAVVARAYRAAIDSYYESPSAFDPAPFAAELETIPSRGYTLGFHSGRLDPGAHETRSAASLAAFEFGGVVRQWDGDDLILEIKNRLVAGDVLEFLLPGCLDVVRLRLYAFTSAETGKVSEKVTAGESRAIRISAAAFHEFSADWLRDQLKPLTVVRKAKPLTSEQRAILQLRTTGGGQPALVPGARLVEGSQNEASRARPVRPPKLGADGCCGLGCNGCLPFWNEPRFENARLRLRTLGGKKLTERDAVLPTSP